MTDPARPTLYLIDGHAHFFRAYHAIRTRMSSPITKEPTSMTFGFMGMLTRLLRDHRPDYLVVAIDVSGDRESFRSEIYPEYKANREKTPEDFHPQVERCVRILEVMGVPVVGEAGVEADDVIASLVRRLVAEEPDLAIKVLTRDKDLTQLISDRVELLDIYKDETITPSKIFKYEGVEPGHVRDILALMGDTTDNVPGVAGIGPKTAAQLVVTYGSIEGVLAHLDEIKGKRRENLESSLEIIELSRRLVTLRDDLDVPLALADAKVEPTAFPVEQLRDVMRELGFSRLQEEFATIAGRGEGGGGSGGGGGGVATSAPPAPEPPGAQGQLFAKTPPRVDGVDEGVYRMIATTDTLDEFLRDVTEETRLAVDTETDSVIAMRANLCGVSLSIEAKTGVYIPIRSPEPERHLDLETVIERLRPVLENPLIAKVGQNLKYDVNVLRRHGIRLAGLSFDTMVASYLIDPTRSSHKLDILAEVHLGYHCRPITDLIGTGRHQRGFHEVPLEQATPYAAEDADITLRLREILSCRLEDAQLTRLFEDVEMPLVDVLADLEFNGIRVDPDELLRQRERLAERVSNLRRAIGEAAPHPFNPDSPKQLAVALFNRAEDDPPGLGLKATKRGKTGPSTDVEVLEKLAGLPEIDTPVPRLVVEYRQLTKLLNTYLVALGEAIHPETRRVHASFNQTVAATGRLSSSDPNLQNIPIRTEIGRQIRRAFVAEPGMVLLTADYSQIELRLLAHLCEDQGLRQAFHDGIDIHRSVAADVFGVAIDAVTSAQRNTAKMVNFGIIYGITAYGLARRLGEGTTVEQAGEFIEQYRRRFPGIDAFLQRCIESAHTDGFVATILGRRRPIEQIGSRNPRMRALGERMAINTVVQGSAADLIKLAMVRLHRVLPEACPAARMLLQIHDELVFEVPGTNAETLRDLVRHEMVNAMTLKVPLIVDVAWSERWIDAK